MPCRGILARPRVLEEPMPEPEDDLIVRAAWLYYVGANNQEETARILDISRVKVTRLLAAARERGLVRITIDHETTRTLEIEAALSQRYALGHCVVTPGLEQVGEAAETGADPGGESRVARRAVGIAGARFLAHRIDGAAQRTIGVGWGRTLAAVAQQLGAVRAQDLRFVSLMGSLTRKSAANPYEVVHQLANRTGGDGYFMPVPFVADSVADRRVLLNQRSVRDVMALAEAADLFLISLGECTRDSLIYRSGLISEAEMTEIEAAGAVGDTLGYFFDAEGRLVDCALNDRSLGVGFEMLRNKEVVLLAAGLEKLQATRALMHSGLVDGLIVDGRIGERLLGGDR
jgi:DNA-binding transcriptional regulator LsrR (DeoR family)